MCMSHHPRLIAAERATDLLYTTTRRIPGGYPPSLAKTPGLVSPPKHTHTVHHRDAWMGAAMPACGRVHSGQCLLCSHVGGELGRGD